MPPYPVMVTCEDGYAVFVGTSRGAMFVLGSGHESGHTLFRNLYLNLNLASTGDFQAGFWCGGGLPWEGPGAAAVFENVHIRALNPGTEYFGWLFYGHCDAAAVIRGCMVNASGAEWAYAVFGDNPPPLVVESCTFVNFPTQSVYQSAAIGLRSSRADGAVAATPPVTVARVLFDASFTNAWPLARFENAGDFPVTMADCILPAAPALPDFAPDVADNVHIVTSQVTWAGFPLADSPAATFGVGAFPPIADDPLLDTDGDGLADYAEAYDLGTDPFLPDSDFDGIMDPVEISEGTDPLNPSNYCFSCVLHLSNSDTIYTNSCCAYNLSGDMLPPVFFSSSNRTVVTMPHVVVTNGVPPSVFAWIDVNENGTWEVGEPNVVRTVLPTNHVIETDIDLLSAGRDMDGDGLPDTWEVLHGLCATNKTDALADTDGDGLINLHEYWAGCDPLSPDGSNTLLSVMARSIDDRIVGLDPTNVVDMFIDYMANGTNFVRNPACWATGIDLSCVSSWNTSAFPQSHGGTLISPRHVLFAKHWFLDVGSGLYFCDGSGSVHYRTIAAVRHLPNVDLTVAALNLDVTNIVPAYVINNSASPYIFTGGHLPVITINQFRTVGVADISDFMSTNTVVMPAYYSFREPKQEQRKSFYVPSRDKDSGSPTFLVENNHLFLVGIRKGFGTDSNVSKYLGEIQMLMDEMAPGYSLQIRNLSGYPMITEE